MRILLATLLIAVAAAQQPAPLEPAKAPLHLVSPVQDKNFYLLGVMQRSPAVNRVLRDHPALASLAQAKREAFINAAKSCALDLSCYATAAKWTDDQIAAVEQAFRDLYARSKAVKEIADGLLPASGVLVRYNSKPGAGMLAQGWTDAAHGINRVIDVYGLGHPPRYPEIDSISFDVKSDTYGQLVQTIAVVLADDFTPADLFFQPSLGFALALMDANHRDEAGRYEPLESGENAAALKRIPSIVWNRFSYSVIVVPGSGTDRETWSLSPYGKLRLSLAAKRFREGKAPFILVTGGFVHPNQTPYCEAIEMKKSLIHDFAIPADAILVDPHARHTTTNIRNAARQIYRYSIPFDKKALITTDPSQSRAIESPAFAKRCMDELGYEPQRLLGRTSIFDLEFLPRIESLYMDSTDPLDP